MTDRVSIKKRLARKTWLKAAYHLYLSLATAVLYKLSPVLLSRVRYRAVYGARLNLRDPRTFDEKLLWLNHYWRHPLKTRCGDKYAVRGYASELGLGDHLPTLYGVFERPEEIDLSSLPDRFVLKCSHGCKYNIFCLDKKVFDEKKARRLLAKWLKKDYSRAYGELHYAAMEPRIICEEFLEEPGAELPSDYKVYCFGGRAHCTMSCTQRRMNGLARYAFYDRDWQGRLPYNNTVNLDPSPVAKPGAYDEMIAMAEKLAAPFPFVRVDFYSIGGRAILGEMTFTPAGCIDPDYTPEAQRILGHMVVLPDRL